MTRRGTTLVEVLVALVVLEVGLLGVVGTLVTAARLITRATVMERGAVEISSTLDSLLAQGWSGGGSRMAPGGVVRWQMGDDSLTWAVFEPHGAGPVVRAWAWVRPSGDPP